VHFQSNEETPGHGEELVNCRLRPEEDKKKNAQRDDVFPL